MAKTQEESNALKEEVETLNNKLKELTEEELGYNWYVAALKYATAAAELNMLAEGKIDTISEETEEVYQECQAMPAVQWIIMLPRAKKIAE